MVRAIVIDRVITALWAFYGVSAMFLNTGLAPWVREAKERLQRRMVNVMQQRVVGVRCFVAEWTCAVTLINRVLCAWSNQHVNCQGGRSSLTRVLLNLLERIEWTLFFFFFFFLNAQSLDSWNYICYVCIVFLNVGYSNCGMINRHS